jgi:hypothetical protein
VVPGEALLGEDGLMVSSTSNLTSP